MIREEKRTAQEVVDYWLYLLRSKIYEQTQERLHDPDGYCCLGILIHADGSYEWHEDYEDQCFYVVSGRGTSLNAILPFEMEFKYGLDRMTSPDEMEYIFKNYEIGLCEPMGTSRQKVLSSLNDASYSFEQIADFVEEMGWDKVEYK